MNQALPELYDAVFVPLNYGHIDQCSLATHDGDRGPSEYSTRRVCLGRGASWHGEDQRQQEQQEGYRYPSHVLGPLARRRRNAVRGLTRRPGGAGLTRSAVAREHVLDGLPVEVELGAAVRTGLRLREALALEDELRCRAVLAILASGTLSALWASRTDDGLASRTGGTLRSSRAGVALVALLAGRALALLAVTWRVVVRVLRILCACRDRAVRDERDGQGHENHREHGVAALACGSPLCGTLPPIA